MRYLRIIGLKQYANTASLFQYTDMLVSSATVLPNHKTSAVSHGADLGVAMSARRRPKVKIIANH
jgi:hypothetical protein